jgi:hypothetical protein
MVLRNTKMYACMRAFEGPNMAHVKYGAHFLEGGERTYVVWPKIYIFLSILHMMKHYKIISQDVPGILLRPHAVQLSDCTVTIKLRKFRKMLYFVMLHSNAPRNSVLCVPYFVSASLCRGTHTFVVNTERRTAKLGRCTTERTCAFTQELGHVGHIASMSIIRVLFSRRQPKFRRKGLP